MADKPSRHWVWTAGGWQSHDRWRCDHESECASILVPPLVLTNEDGSRNPWRLEPVWIVDSV